MDPTTLPPNIVKCLPQEEKQRLGLVARPAQPPTPATAAKPAPAAKPRRRPVQHEQAIQRTVVEWWELSWRRLGAGDVRQLMYVPNHPSNDPRRAGILRGLGLRPGVPDLFLAMPQPPVPFSVVHPGVPGLWIELKAGPKSQVRPEQETMHAVLQFAGYRVVVARSATEAIDAIEGYLLR